MYRIILCTLLSFTPTCVPAVEPAPTESAVTNSVASIPAQANLVQPPLVPGAVQNLDAPQIKSLLLKMSQIIETFEEPYQHNVHHFNHQAKPYDAFKIVQHYEKPILNTFQVRFPGISIPNLWDHPAALVGNLGHLIGKVGLCIPRQEVCFRSLNTLENHMARHKIESTETYANVFDVLARCCRLAMLLDIVDQDRNALGSSMLVESLYENMQEDQGCYAGYAGRFLRDYIYLIHFSLETLMLTT